MIRLGSGVKAVDLCSMSDIKNVVFPDPEGPATTAVAGCLKVACCLA